MIKPVVAKELAARIRAMLRRIRTNPAFAGPTVAGTLEVRPAEGVVLRNGEAVALTTTELRLITELAAQVGQPVSRETLLEQVWGYDYFGDARLVDVHISRLRHKVEEDPGHPSRVVTVRGLGYKLVP
jgi:DNA-binding response OmpR family regulator